MNNGTAATRSGYSLRPGRRARVLLPYIEVCQADGCNGCVIYNRKGRRYSPVGKPKDGSSGLTEQLSFCPECPKICVLKQWRYVSGVTGMKSIKAGSSLVKS